MGERARKLENASEALGALIRTIEQYRRQLAGYEETVRTAHPESEMSEVAAATAGVSVLQRAIKELVSQLEHADESYRARRDNHDRAWSRVLRLQALLTGHAPLIDEFDRRRLDRTELQQELRQLIGFVPE